MAEYIEREAAIDAVTAVYARTAGYKTRERIWEAREAIQKLSAADVAPVVHGEWLRADDDWHGLTTIQCSICGEEWCFETIDDVSLLNYKHCPNCGADMREVDHEQKK